MAKKKYYQGPKDRMHESRGMKKYSNDSHDMMPMHSDAMSNMPQEVVMREYSRDDYMPRGEYPDTYSEKTVEQHDMARKMKNLEFRGY